MLFHEMTRSDDITEVLVGVDDDEVIMVKTKPTKSAAIEPREITTMFKGQD